MFPRWNVKAFLFSPTCAKCLSHILTFDLITRNILGAGHRSRDSASCATAPCFVTCPACVLPLMCQATLSCITFWSLPVTWCTNSLTFNNCTFCPHCMYMCFVFIWEKTATCATYSINWLVFVTEMKSVYSAVRTGSFNKAVCASSLKGYHSKIVQFFLCVECFVLISEKTAAFALYVINWLVFITLVESVYSAVRTDSLYKADYVSSLQG
jgi:hypothetical protein